ncbi:hypothetical protein V5799_020859, partial [Amblyomma americanum]
RKKKQASLSARFASRRSSSRLVCEEATFPTLLDFTLTHGHAQRRGQHPCVDDAPGCLAQAEAGERRSARAPCSLPPPYCSWTPCCCTCFASRKTYLTGSSTELKASRSALTV